jgi:hypothetical protein
MKKRIIILTILFSTCLYSQSKFAMGFSLNEQFVKKDRGINHEGFITYNFNQDLAINAIVSYAEVKNKELDLKYTLDKYSILMSYDFAKTERTKLQSLFGFSYLNFDKKFLQNDNKGLGIDMGVQVTLSSKSKLNYGLKMVSTFSSIAPGGMFNAGVFFKYNL